MLLPETVTAKWLAKMDGSVVNLHRTSIGRGRFIGNVWIAWLAICSGMVNEVGEKSVDHFIEPTCCFQVRKARIPGLCPANLLGRNIFLLQLFLSIDLEKDIEMEQCAFLLLSLLSS